VDIVDITITIPFDKANDLDAFLKGVGGIIKSKNITDSHCTGSPHHFVKNLMALRNITQRELARELKLTESHFSAVVSGRKPLGRKIALKLAEYFSVDYHLFL